MKKIIANSILVFLLLLFIIRYLPGFIGYQTYAIQSGSMEPKYSIGSMIFVEECSFMDIKVNDVITFIQSDSVLSKTHRVISIDQNKLQFITKGDHNKEEDAKKVSAKALIGKVVFSIPLLGYLNSFFSMNIGYVTLITLAMISIILAMQDKKTKNKVK